MSEKRSILWDNDADGGGSGQSSDDDGEARVSPSHGSQSAFNANVGDHISGDQDLSADASYMTMMIEHPVAVQSSE